MAFGYWYKIRVAAISTAIVVLVSSCTAQHQPAPIKSENRAKEEVKIREAVFRDLFLRPCKPAVYCLFVAEGDPPAEFLGRFRGNRIPVRKGSRCISTLTGITEKGTGKRAAILAATRITWITESSVEVSGGYYEAGLSAEHYTFEVGKQGGIWKVISTQLKSIS